MKLFSSFSLRALKYSTVFASMLSAQSACAQVDTIQIADLKWSGRSMAAGQRLPRSAPSSLDRHFLEGLVAQHASDYQTAARAFAAAIDADPDHLNARREFAHVLFQQSKYTQSEREFRDLLSRDHSPNAHQVYLGFLAEIARRKPYGVTGYLSFLPSTNVNRGSQNSLFESSVGEFVIEPRSRAQSGLGISGGISGYFRKALSERWRYVVSWDIVRRWYEDPAFNSMNTTLRFSHEFSMSPARLVALGLNAQHASARENSSSALEASVLYQIRFAQTDRLAFKLSHQWKEYRERRHASGRTTTLFMQFDRRARPSLRLSLSARIIAHRPQKMHLRYKGIRIETGVTKSWSGGAIIGFGLFAEHRSFLGNFPLTDFRRLDTAYGIRASLQHNQLEVQGFIPSLACQTYRNRSNTAFYDHTVYECDLTVSKRF